SPDPTARRPRAWVTKSGTAERNVSMLPPAANASRVACPRTAADQAKIENPRRGLNGTTLVCRLQLTRSGWDRRRGYAMDDGNCAAGGRAAALEDAGTSGVAVRAHGSAGFTLVELLVVVAVIAILAAVAIPAFSSYRADGYDAHAISALNSLAKAEEAYFASRGRYTLRIADLPPYYPPSGVQLDVTIANAQLSRAEARHPAGSKTFRWDSDLGGLQP